MTALLSVSFVRTGCRSLLIGSGARDAWSKEMGAIVIQSGTIALYALNHRRKNLLLRADTLQCKCAERLGRSAADGGESR